MHRFKYFVKMLQAMSDLPGSTYCRKSVDLRQYQWVYPNHHCSNWMYCVVVRTTTHAMVSQATKINHK